MSPVNYLKLKINRKIAVVFAALVIVLIVTNPSRNNYFDYLGYSKEDEDYLSVKRETNFFVCSIYSYKRGESEESRVKHFGILGNFFQIEKKNY